MAVALKMHMLSVVDSVQEFLLRRLSGELREVSVFTQNPTGKTKPGLSKLVYC